MGFFSHLIHEFVNGVRRWWFPPCQHQLTKVLFPVDPNPVILILSWLLFDRNCNAKKFLIVKQLRDTHKIIFELPSFSAAASSSSSSPAASVGSTIRSCSCWWSSPAASMVSTPITKNKNNS